MGDRVSVSLTVRKSQADKVEKFLKEADYEIKDRDDYIEKTTEKGLELVQFNLYGCNYGDIGIEFKLKSNRIPYVKEIDEGMEVDECIEALRFDRNGKQIYRQVFVGCETSIDAEKIVHMIKDSNMVELLSYLKQERQNVQPNATVVSLPIEILDALVERSDKVVNSINEEFDKNNIMTWDEQEEILSQL